jgi:hypothetical protein
MKKTPEMIAAQPYSESPANRHTGTNASVKNAV